MDSLKNRCYSLLKTVPTGKVTTYKALAGALHTKAYRAIGQFMRTNPYAPIVPCHRVVASDGSIGGFNGKTTGKNIERKIALLKQEGVLVQKRKIIDFQKKLYTFNVR